MRFFFFNDTATTEIYTLSLHDALPILTHYIMDGGAFDRAAEVLLATGFQLRWQSYAFNEEEGRRSEEHTSELQSRSDLVCRLLLEKKKICKLFNLPRLRTLRPTLGATP